LTIAGFWTSTVASALQTLELFRLRTFDLALVDAMLQGLGAAELVQRLRSKASGDSGIRTDIPVLLIAGSQDEISPHQALAMGADGVHYPPIEIEDFALDLFARIRLWREQHPGRPWADELAQRKS
jgi:CheY-like chemotaxis protein